MPNLFGRPLWSYLPFGSAVYFQDNHNNYHLPFWQKLSWATVHAFYQIGGAVALGMYLKMLFCTGSFNPIEQNRISVRKKYLNEKVFGYRGIADTDFSGAVDNEEVLRVYKKLGLGSHGERILFPGRTFPEPSLEQLEKLVKEYGGDN